MKIVYIICINISENFEGNVNFEYLVKGDYMMTRYILKRLGYMVLSLFIIITITFFLMKMMPGSPFNDAKLSAEQKAILNEKYGLNDPVAVQYLHYLKNVVTGDFGYSFQYHNQPVWSLIKPRLIPLAGWEGFSTAVLPSLALSASVMATVARYIRAEMIEVLSSDYILLARAKGNSPIRVLFGHALRNALIPIITIIVPMLAGILTGTLTIENIFGVPGLGDQFVRSITTNDFSVIMATTILFSTLFIVSIFIVDILYGVIDPRIRVQGGKK